MTDKQYIYVVACLIVSGICCIAAAINSYINTKNLNNYMQSLENKTV